MYVCTYVRTYVCMYAVYKRGVYIYIYYIEIDMVYIQSARERIVFFLVFEISIVTTLVHIYL